ncbi:MAG TPA: ATP-binding protein [Thermoanaerobaculia bacterium]|nr:ATP-binding protein [Thermoanaerobaculia bacterium]
MSRALVVDDSKVDRELISGLLQEEAGLEVETAADGREAFERLQREDDVDLLVTDLAMPSMSGLDLVAKAIELRPGLPVVVVTSRGSEEAASRALHVGAASYVRKADLAGQLSEVAHRLVTSAIEQRARRWVYTAIERCSAVFDLPNDREAFPAVIAFVQELADGAEVCDETARMRLGVALEEALVNAAEHGNLEMDSALREHDRAEYLREARRRRRTEPWASRRVRFDLELTEDELRLVVRDEGSGFDPHDLPDPKDPKNLLRVHGRGILLMRTFMDEVTYNERGNQVSLVKRRRKTPA